VPLHQLAVTPADVSGVRLGLALNAPAPPPLASCLLDHPDGGALLLGVLGASHVITVEHAAGRFSEQVSCTAGSLGVDLPERTDAPGYCLESRTETHDEASFRRLARELRERCAYEAGWLGGSFPGDVTGPVLDATLNASGGTGSSLKYVIPANAGANSSGNYWINFSDDLLTQFGQGGEFYVQWRQRFSPEFITTIYAGGGGWKQAIIGEGDNPGCTSSTAISKDQGGNCAFSCTQLEIVTQNILHREIPQMYHSCGVKDGNYEPLDVVTAGSSIHPQYATPDLTNCLYPGPYTTANCIPYQANQWMTFQVHVKVGTWYQNDHVYHYDSAIHLWIALQGQGSRLAIRSFGAGLVLIQTQQVEGKQNCQKGRLGRKERLQTKAVDSQIMFEFFNPLLDTRAPVVIGPQVLRTVRAVGNPDPEGVTGHLQQSASTGRLVIPNPLANYDKAPSFGPTP